MKLTRACRRSCCQGKPHLLSDVPHIFPCIPLVSASSIQFTPLTNLLRFPTQMRSITAALRFRRQTSHFAPIGFGRLGTHFSNRDSLDDLRARRSYVQSCNCFLWLSIDRVQSVDRRCSLLNVVTFCFQNLLHRFSKLNQRLYQPVPMKPDCTSIYAIAPDYTKLYLIASDCTSLVCKYCNRH
jgi:hypothetical protein